MAHKPDEAIASTGEDGLSPAVAGHQRERLFTAIVELVAKRGYRETSVDHIVKTAQVGRATFYELYEGKEDCLLAAFDRIVEETEEALAAAVSSEDEWTGQMTAGLSCLLDLVVAEPRRARIALVEVQAAGPRAYSRYEKAVDRAAPKLREGRAYSKEAAALSGALEEAILGGALWVVHQRLVNGRLNDADQLLEETIQIVLSPYVGEVEAKRLADATLQARSRRN